MAPFLPFFFLLPLLSLAQLNDDILGLIVFKSAISDPSSFLSSWNQDDDSPCSWKFVTCNSATGRVSQLNLTGLGLSGKLGKGLEKLQHLKLLSLSNNNLTGQIPPDIAFIPALQSLNLSSNALSGLVPSSFSNFTSLKFLDLSSNSLSGPLPDDLFRTSYSLRYLSLAHNAFQGPLPSSLKACSTLNTLNLSNNQFSGNPDFSSLWSFKRLRTLDLSSNEFSGSLPMGISFLSSLKELHVQNNRFSGSLPSDLGLCIHLNKLDLSDNLFTGPLPRSAQHLRSLNYFDSSMNMLSGDCPQWIGNLASLQHLDLSSNRITGDIPNSIVQCSSLSVIRLRGNSLSGVIPKQVFNLGLHEVDFSDNKLVGSIPPGSSNFYRSVETVDLSRNNLVGNISSVMGLFSNLRYLNLSWNENLQSEMPQELGYLLNLTVLDLRNAGIYGSIPSDICELGNLRILQLDWNALTGLIPQEIGNCSSLNLLSLSHNNLIGPIPKSISKLTKLEILKLEFNELSGEIPLELGKLENLLAVNISYNRLIGRLPTEGIFPSLNPSALQGNLGICSPLLKGPCKMNVPKPLVLNPFAYGTRNQSHGQDLLNNSHHQSLLTASAIIAISAAVFIVFGVFVICLLNISARRRLAFIDHALESMCSSSSRSGSHSATRRLILFDSKSSSPEWTSNPESILNKATEIGEGVFGTVYKVLLGGSGSRVRVSAVKKLFTSNLIQYPEDFDREVRLLGKAKHPNLVSITGYYWTPQLQLLVSEFSPAGSLQARLHSRPPSTPPLSWANRFKIVLGTAKGLAYLHHSFRPPIIHYNIKPSNILLDENCNPKVSDFGLARLLTKLDKHVLSNRFQSALGYVAPELACQSLRVNEKCDVYGFGILILELVTGRRPVEYGEDNVVILNDHIRVLLEQGNVLECVDDTMGDYPEDEVLPVLKLALVCTSQIPSSRPSMAEVVQILQVIKTPVPNRMDMF